MGEYSSSLPQLGGDLFLTDGGLETTLVFHDGIDLPCFAAFDLLREEEGVQRLDAYYEQYFDIARGKRVGFVLESPTWRANPDWGHELGYAAEDLDAMNRAAIRLLHRIRERANHNEPIVISGCVGPRGDGYNPAAIMSAREAEDYHARQVAVFANQGVDLVTAITMTNVPESVGIVRAAAAHGLPAAISFTVETDGRLPTGESLRDAIGAVDEQTDGQPAYYMVNCAHPTHFGPALTDGDWLGRIRGVRANASRMSHAELDESTELDDGDPAEFGLQHRELRERHPHLSVLGGCCGTDHRHVQAIADACVGRRPARGGAG